MPALTIDGHRLPHLVPQVEEQTPVRLVPARPQRWGHWRALVAFPLDDHQCARQVGGLGDHLLFLPVGQGNFAPEGRASPVEETDDVRSPLGNAVGITGVRHPEVVSIMNELCLLYTSDAADEEDSVDL